MYGVGVYVSETVTTSLSYARNDSILICAVIEKPIVVKKVGAILVIFDELRGHRTVDLEVV